MDYLITFLEGVISFISPCMLPLLPVYLSYFAGQSGKKGKMLANACAFVLGFTAVFCALGLFAGTLSTFLVRYRAAVRAVGGCIVILFGLNCLEVVRLPFFKGMAAGRTVTGICSAFLFGLVYSVSLTPCIGAFLGSALMLASVAGTALKGLSLLLVYSAGLGLPFLASALLLDQLQSAFRFVKTHYRQINLVCGVFLILVGAAMALGLMDRLLALLA